MGPETNTSPRFMENIVREAISNEVSRIVEEMTEGAKQLLERRLKTMAAEVSIRIMDYVKMETLAHELVIRVDTRDLRIGRGGTHG